jgi:hypothetical protein
MEIAIALVLVIAGLALIFKPSLTTTSPISVKLGPSQTPVDPARPAVRLNDLKLVRKALLENNISEDMIKRYDEIILKTALSEDTK